jgi:hypothetical protein
MAVPTLSAEERITEKNLKRYLTRFYENARMAL